MTISPTARLALHRPDLDDSAVCLDLMRAGRDFQTLATYRYAEALVGQPDEHWQQVTAQAIAEGYDGLYLFDAFGPCRIITDTTDEACPWPLS